jgi:hypothetical protein
MGDQVLVAPPGITRPDQFAERNTQPMPPRAGNSLIVGGPAYFTPEGYQAPYQPEQSFMPTNVAPDPIRDQFNRMYPTPPPPPPPPAAPTPDPVYEPVVEPVPPQPDPRDLPPIGITDPPPSGAYPPYIPGVTPFPGIPGLGDLDFSGLPGMGDIDIDRIIQEYQDRQNAGEPEPFDSFLPTPPPPAGPAPQEDEPKFFSVSANTRVSNFINSGGMGTMDMYTASDGREFGSGTVGRMYDEYLASLGQQDSNTSAPTPAPEPEFVPPPQEPNGFFPGINPEDFEDFDFGETTGNPYGAILNRPSRVPFDGQINEAALQAIQSPGSKDFRAPRTPQAQAPAPVYTPPPSQIPMQGMMDDYDFGNPNLRNMRRFDPRR